MKISPTQDVAAKPPLAGEPAPRLSLARRVLLLLACCAAGLAIGVIGQGYTAQPAWFLAVPVCIAVGWIFVADPSECLQCDAARPQDPTPPAQ